MFNVNIDSRDFTAAQFSKLCSVHSLACAFLGLLHIGSSSNHICILLACGECILSHLQDALFVNPAASDHARPKRAGQFDELRKQTQNLESQLVTVRLFLALHRDLNQTMLDKL